MSESIKCDNLKVIQIGKNEDMKLLVFMIIALTIAITPAFAELDLSNEKITSTDNRLILQFAENTIQQFRTHTEIIPHIEFGIVDLGNVELQLDDARVNVLGDSFTIKNDNIALYAKNIGNDRFSINTYINTNTGIQKNTFTANIITTESTQLITPKLTEEITKVPYKPDLKLTSSHDFRTFWKDTFNIDVQAFDGRINPNPTSSDFDGRINGVDVKVLLSLNDIQVATLSGVTTNGEWEGEYFFKENISAPGEYAVDVIISYLGETVSKSSTMFVIADTLGGDSTNHAPIANAGFDQPTATSPVTLDGTGSSDPDGDTITFSWVKTSGIAGSLSGAATDTATFTTGATGIAVFELTVTDIKGKSSTDSVTITVS